MTNHCPIHGHTDNVIVSNGVPICPVAVQDLNLDTGETTDGVCSMPLEEPPDGQ
jgi:hypothetical protein